MYFFKNAPFFIHPRAGILEKNELKCKKNLKLKKVIFFLNHFIKNAPGVFFQLIYLKKGAFFILSEEKDPNIIKKIELKKYENLYI